MSIPIPVKQQERERESVSLTKFKTDENLKIQVNCQDDEIK